ncbi:hypothetical protein GUJ93_ZPchr0013g35641 [Zizania palustris]|uniref:PROP1-like PPR domain-containing protein n=1 Tax=Zizania palustris TaxID=103762 RepID=A0A8J6BUS0_ZIZPA|nr:hypothetical protein GUJ93_ZPchr0013g35641 [Zizania palustris]
MPFRPTLLRLCSDDPKLYSFLSAVGSLAASHSGSRFPPAGSLPASHTPAAYNGLMSKYSRAGRHDEVLRLFRSLPFAPTVPLFTTLISSLAYSGRHLAARAAFASLLRSGLPLTASAFTALLKSHDAPDFVDRVFRAMEASGCSPDAAIYNWTISMLCDFQLVQEALGFLDHMLENGPRPTVRSFTAILRTYCEQGRMGFLEEAFRQADVMRSRGLSMTTETVHILFDCLCRDSRFSEAVCLLELSEELGWDVDVFCYNTLMSRLCDIDDFARVLKLLVDMLKKGIGPDMLSFTIAIRSLCQAGKLRLAKSLIDDKGIKYDAVAFNTLIHGFCMAGDLDKVQQTHMDMISRANQLAEYGCMPASKILIFHQGVVEFGVWTNACHFILHTDLDPNKLPSPNVILERQQNNRQKVLRRST